MTESATAYTIFKRGAMLPGYAVIIPKRHVADYFELSRHEKTACWLMVDRVQSLLQKRIQPAGYNLVVNVGAVAEQDILHAHIQLIPRVTETVMRIPQL